MRLQGLLGRRQIETAGVVTAVIGLTVSFAGRGLIPGRELGDPVVLTLSLSQLVQSGYGYFNWRSLIFHGLFILFLSGLAVVVLWLFNGRQPVSPGKAVLVARLAAAINVTAVALTEVDALIVAFWYLVAGILSVYLTGFVAQKIAAWWLA